MDTVDTIDENAAPGAHDQQGDVVPVSGSEANPGASDASLAAATALINSSPRRVDPPVRKSFVRPMVEADGDVAPMAQIYRGGRSGVVALKLYLALLWRCSSPPFQTDKPARAWATLLDLEDPSGRGARRVKNAMQMLAAANLIQISAQPGYPNVTTLLDESGSGRAYELPSTAYKFGKMNKASKENLASNTYFKVPQRLWRDGYIQGLSGPGLVMLLILLAEQGAEGAKVWFSTEEFPRRYNISHKSRAAGTAELQRAKLLRVESQSLAASQFSSTFDVQRRRKVYMLTKIAQIEVAEPAIQIGKMKKRKLKRLKTVPAAVKPPSILVDSRIEPGG